MKNALNSLINAEIYGSTKNPVAYSVDKINAGEVETFKIMNSERKRSLTLNWHIYGLFHCLLLFEETELGN
jgi:hypothetical protein